MKAINLSLALVMAASAVSAADFAIKLTVHESAGVARLGEPVSGGIPLPQGLVKDPAELKLVGSDGATVPAQLSVINRWAADGSIMWLLVQGTASVPANGQTVFTLRPGPATAKRSLLKVEDGAAAVTIDTGKIKFAVSKKKFNLVDSAWFDADADGKYAGDEQVVASDPHGGSVLTVKNGEAYASSAAAPTDVVVEEAGPERAIILIRGLHTAEGGKGQLPWCYGYIVRIRAYAGQPYLQISYAFTDDAMPPIGSLELKDSVIGIPLKLGAAVTAALGGATHGPDRPSVSGALAVGKEAAIVCDGELTMKPRRSTMAPPRVVGLAAPAELTTDLGWAAAVDGRLGVMLSVRYLRENWPSVLKVRRDGELTWLELKPWPAEVETERFLDVCSHKTYELELTLGAAGAMLEGAPGRFAAYNNSLRYWPAAEWTSASKAWGDFGGLMLADAGALKEISDLEPYKFNGWRDFGSTPLMESGASTAPDGGYEPLAKTGAWYLGYLQTGQRRLFDQIERLSWHWRDRRKIHIEKAIEKNKWAGDGVYSKYAKEGAKAFPDLQPVSYDKTFIKGNVWGYGGRFGPMDTQHFSVDEVVNYYYLTGDRQCLVAMNKYAEEAAQFVMSTLEDVAKEGSGRAHGWTARALVTVYEATGEKRWFEAAEKMVRAVALGQDKTAGTISPVIPPPDAKHQVHTPFMAAAVGMALGRYYRHHPDEEVFDTFMGIADWLLYDASSKNGFPYHWGASEPLAEKFTTSGNRCLSTMSWAYTATGQKRYLDAAETHAAFKKPGYWALNGFGQEYLLNKTGKRADATPPAAVSDLSAESVGDGKVRVSWTAPGDDGSQGQAARYQVKYAAREIKEHSDWRTEAGKTISFWAATNVKGEPKPSAAGSKETCTAEGLSPGTYWFTLKTYDEQPNQSDLSNVVKIEVK